ncbi:hypothetical protein FRC07_005840 [Ceratobasidium sp. 392]|nr:hypothetical protein FRC07_005840 [Ceratobasidium sp. 392]
MSVSQLVTILTSNPAISILKLGRLKITSPEDWVPPTPILLNHLKVLNLINLQADSLRLLLPLISLPSAPDELSVGLSFSGDDQVKELEDFLARSQMTTLYCLCSQNTVRRTLVSLPCLDTLILHQLMMFDEPPSEISVPPQPAQYSHIANVILLSSIVTFTGLERFVAEHCPQNISLEQCSARAETSHDLQAMRSSLLELYPKLGCTISDTDSSSRLPCRTMFDHST